MPTSTSPRLRTWAGLVVLALPPLLCTPYFYLWYQAGPYPWANRYEPYLFYVMGVAALLGCAGFTLFPISRLAKGIGAGLYFAAMALALFIYGFFWCPLCDF